MAEKTLVMVGTYEGQTVALALGLTTYSFTDGRITISGSQQDVDALTRVLGLNFQALPEGSEELAALQEEIACAREIHPDREGAQRPTDLQGGDSANTQVIPEPGNGSGDGEGATGEAGAGDATRDGARAIVEALSKLAPTDDANWNADGKPKMAAIEALLGRTDITRAQVEAAAPGFTRPTA